MNCLHFVNSLPDNRKILIRGNHEDLMEDAINRDCFYGYDESNGTMYTVLQLVGEKTFYDGHGLLAMQNCEEWNTYIKSCRNYYETNNSILVHGWIPCEEEWEFHNTNFLFSDFWREGDWEGARWYNGMDMWKNGIVVNNKTIYCGHWHTSYGHAVFHKEGTQWGEDALFTPFIDKGIVALDACTAHSKFVNCFVVEGNEF